MLLNVETDDVNVALLTLDICVLVSEHNKLAALVMKSEVIDPLK
jgi:hypothetical protein